MKKETDSNLREALRSIIQDSAPLTPDWQQEVLDSLGDAKKPRRLVVWMRRIASVAAVALLIYIGVRFQDSPQPAAPVMPIAPIAAPEPPVIAEVTAPEPIPEKPAPAPVRKPAPVEEIGSEIAAVIMPEIPDEISDNPMDNLEVNEWIDAVINNELMNHYVSMVSIFDSENDVNE